MSKYYITITHSLDSFNILTALTITICWLNTLFRIIISFSLKETIIPSEWNELYFDEKNNNRKLVALFSCFYTKNVLLLMTTLYESPEVSLEVQVLKFGIQYPVIRFMWSTKVMQSIMLGGFLGGGITIPDIILSKGFVFRRWDTGLALFKFSSLWFSNKYEAFVQVIK